MNTLIEGFYDHRSLPGLYLLLYNNSMDNFDVYHVSSSSSIKPATTTHKESVLWKRANFIMPFDHYPSLEELQQLPELFI